MKQPLSIPTETLLTDPELFGLTTASPLQRAWCRAKDGLPLGELAEHPDVIAGFGGVEAIRALPKEPALEQILLAGIRSGKSLLAAVSMFGATQSVNCSGLGHGDIPRVSLLSLRKDLAAAVYEHFLGNVATSKILKNLLLEEPTSERILVRHPSGRPIEIKITAGAGGGAAFISRWSAGGVVDEAPRVASESDGFVINYDETRRYALGRLLPGAQFISIGSPHAPRGSIYERVTSSFGKPSRDLVIVRGTGPMMNPVWWTKERCEDLQRRDQHAYETDVLGEFSDPESTFYTQTEIRRATRAEPMVRPPEKQWAYAAGIDPATRGNSWPLVIVGAQRAAATGEVRYRVVLAKQWTGSPSAPLSPMMVLREVARLVKPYGIQNISSDQHSSDANRDLAHLVGLELVIRTTVAQNRNELYERLKGVLESNAIELPPDRTLLDDLGSVRRRLTPTGVTYHLPKTANGRHADYVPALALAICAFPGHEERIAQANMMAMARSMYLGLAAHNAFGQEGLDEVREVQITERRDRQLIEFASLREEFEAARERARVEAIEAENSKKESA